MLWSAFAVLTLLVVGAIVFTIAVLQMEKRAENEVITESRPLLDAVTEMNMAMQMAISAARAYTLTQQTQFLENYDSAVGKFEAAATTANDAAITPRDIQIVVDFRNHFRDLRKLLDRQIELAPRNYNAARQLMLEASRHQREAPDFAGSILGPRRVEEERALQRIESARGWVVLIIVLIGFIIIVAAGLAVSAVEGWLNDSIGRQVKRTEAMIAGMSDGVMLVDGEGKTVSLNPAAQKLLGISEVGVTIEHHAEVYRLHGDNGRPLDPQELPAAQALATGRPVEEVTMEVARGDQQVMVAMSAMPLQEDGRVTGVVVTFRDITERRRLEEDMQLQAERSQILADAGAFFASNIDPVWVTQAIAERVAEVLGDWAAVILRSGDSPDLRVASIYHRDMTSLGLAWSYIYRQPLSIGEGIIGQVVATGVPSLTRNVPGVTTSFDADASRATYHRPHMQLASLLILPLRTRREMLGALVIAANDPDRGITDDKLPLAEILAERAALAIENSKLYTDQVEARRKVEDLSRLKDEFLSIASHELRTPVTSIKGYTQLAKTLIRENDLGTAEEYLDIALDQIDRMSRLILELLDVSRIETGRLEIRREAINWTSFVSDVVHRHHTAVSARQFHLNVALDGRVVTGDRDRLEQVLGNLLENAVKYSPDGSDIFVNVEYRGDDVVTSVADRGIGIPADELGQVFERFHRGRQVSSTNYGGLGLGLYISKQIVERHSGSIWVESKEGAGTTFFFSLPAVPASVAQSPTTGTSSKAEKAAAGARP